MNHINHMNDMMKHLGKNAIELRDSVTVMKITTEVSKYLKNFPLMPVADKDRVMKNALSLATPYIKAVSNSPELKIFTESLMRIVANMVSLTYKSTEALYDDMKSFYKFRKNENPNDLQSASSLAIAYDNANENEEYEPDTLVNLATKIIADFNRKEMKAYKKVMDYYTKAVKDRQQVFPSHELFEMYIDEHKIIENSTLMELCEKVVVAYIDKSYPELQKNPCKDIKLETTTGMAILELEPQDNKQKLLNTAKQLYNAFTNDIRNIYLVQRNKYSKLPDKHTRQEDLYNLYELELIQNAQGDEDDLSLQDNGKDEFIYTICENVITEHDDEVTEELMKSFRAWNNFQLELIKEELNANDTRIPKVIVWIPTELKEIVHNFYPRNAIYMGKDTENEITSYLKSVNMKVLKVTDGCDW